MQPAIERRSVPRLAVDYPVIFFHSAPNDPASRLYDLSTVGAAVEATTPFPIGAQTSFLFLINGHEVVECTARVIDVLPLADSKYRVSVWFTRLSKEAQNRIAELFGREGSNSSEGATSQRRQPFTA